MKIIEDLFKWFKAEDKDGKEIPIGYVLEGEPKTLKEIETIFRAFQLDKYFEAVKPLVKPKIDLKLEPFEETRLKVGQSKIGGLPDLETDATWPLNENGKSLSFIGQLNFEEIALYDKSDLLPKNGLLSFFYCADQEVWGFDPNDNRRFKVLYFEQIANLARRDFPADLEPYSRYAPNRIIFDCSLSLPTLLDDAVEMLIEKGDMDNYLEASSGSDNQIFGYANCVQQPMELECQLVTHGIYCGDTSGYEDPRSKELEPGKSDWILLLQIDSEYEKTGMMWGDSGRIYFWIRKQDLAKKDFSKVWCILQCF